MAIGERLYRIQKTGAAVYMLRPLGSSIDTEQVNECSRES